MRAFSLCSIKGEPLAIKIIHMSNKLIYGLVFVYVKLKNVEILQEGIIITESENGSHVEN